MEDYQAIKKQLADTEGREKELLSRVGDLADFIENAPMPLHWVNGSGIVIWVNKAELDMLGYTKEEMLNKHIGNFHADPHVIEDILRRLMNRETLINYPARLKCKSGAVRNVLINSNVYSKNGEFVHTRCFTHDVTGLKEAELNRSREIERLQEENEKLRAEIGRLSKLA